MRMRALYMHDHSREKNGPLRDKETKRDRERHGMADRGWSGMTTQVPPSITTPSTLFVVTFAVRGWRRRGWVLTS